MPTSGNACARKGRSETWQFAKNQFWSDFVRKQTFRESRQVLLRKRMRRGFEFVLILQTTRGSNFGLLATEVYLTSFIILVFSTCVRSIGESLGETTPAGSYTRSPPDNNLSGVFTSQKSALMPTWTHFSEIFVETQFDFLLAGLTEISVNRGPDN
ncbi:hypothetical protein AVEN_46414-1 [Araneus ventricosus]|uniref:Uncharacterized protein n=1 Tax=Araneus ventricosus TaxID=182803 RepID=A0A4Y2I6Q0_ARAVE|nr:hypothetical protein AVEN_46414-1 [Araneus ventricosus]